MSEPYSHLEPTVRLLIERPPEDRITFVESDQWVGYPAAIVALDRLRSTLKQARSRRMGNTLLVADSNNGKSTILQIFSEEAQNAPRLRDPDGRPGDQPMPVVLIEMPRKAKEELFWKAILRSLSCAPPRRAEDLEAYTYAICERLQVRVLMIDELHHILLGRPSEQRDQLALLKSLSNRLRLPIVAAGTAKAEIALASDDQTENRFEPFYLPRWQLNKTFQSFVASYERLLPLAEPSGLTEREPLTALYNVSGGTVGRAVRILQRATIAAISDRQTCVTVPMIETAARLPYGKDRSGQAA